MSTWLAPVTTSGRVPQTEAYYACCSFCGNLGLFKNDVEGARTAIDDHVCAILKPKIERVVYDCEPISSGCKQKAVHR